MPCYIIPSMAQKLTQAQKDRFKRLIGQLKVCCLSDDFESAKVCAQDIRSLANATGERHRWLLALNILSETAIRVGNNDFAIQHLNSVVHTSNKSTRLRLEAYTLLAIAYLRTGDIDNAKKSIDNTISSIKNIRAQNSREVFYKKLVERIEEESILAGARLDSTPILDVDEVQSKAVELLQESEAQLLARIGNELPDKSINLFTMLRDSTLLQIPHQERLCLPPPSVAVPSSSIGKKAMSALKHVCWTALCDRDDELYKAWSDGLSAVYDKKLIAGAVVTALIDAKIGSGLFAVSVVAYVFKFSCRTFCEAFAPDTIMKRTRR